MAEASISVDHDQFNCPVCLDLLKDPVTVPCGHSFCMVCINGCWDKEDRWGIYSCPQCRETFTPRPVLRKNNMLAEVVEKLKKNTELQAASPAPRYAGAHYEVPAWKKHNLVKASTQLQEKICSQHDRLIEIYCRTDQRSICYLCTMEEHKDHDTVSATTERTEKQNQLKEMQEKLQQRIQENQKNLQELEQTVNTLKVSAQAAVEDSERIFTELIRSIEKKRSEVTELIRDQEKAELSGAEELLEKLQQEMADLKRRHTELEQLSHTEDHIHFLQSFQSLCVSSGSDDSPSITVHQHPSFDGVRKSLSELKERLEEFCREEFRKIHLQAEAFQILPSQPKTREDFLQYFVQLTLDPNTAYNSLILSEDNRVVKYTGTVQPYSDHPERFTNSFQVLCKESLCGRCYWEIEWNRRWFGGFSVSVSYKEISRKGRGKDCSFGRNSQSWSLHCSPSLCFNHNNKETYLLSPPSSRIGVYVDHSAGTLSFYNVSDTMTLLHTLHTTFTQPLYAGFWVFRGTVRLSDKN
ncbi:tripartite motif-containing protein 16-like protein isoform X1 [Astyanax mexicanus]|uniref:tripartite motif-containing protein 16-like protein isoform X1 n=1 Tax=Astyanax mexicanus TaxID=7994 RepID=UPI0020CA9DD3|nr:tripartite motif-containing protein 16-like protein isoform X1 [Astyanax mexicanus]